LSSQNDLILEPVVGVLEQSRSGYWMRRWKNTVVIWCKKKSSDYLENGTQRFIF
jgi:hypothetical protein